MSELLSLPDTAALIHRYGYWTVFALIALESMGLLVPGEAALVAAALIAGATGDLDIAGVVAAAAAGAIVGDNMGYVIGRRLGLPLLVRHGCKIGLTGDRFRIGQYLFWRHGGKIVFFGRFVALLRAFAALLAGANRMPWRHFLLMNALGGVAWASLYGIAAYRFGEAMRRVTGALGAALFIAAAIAVIAGLLLVRRHEKELAARARRTLPDLGVP